MNKQNKNLRFARYFVIGVAIIVLLTLTLSLTSAYLRSSPQYVYPGASFGEIGPDIMVDERVCRAEQDFIVQIAPFGCTPAVVRSDLLEEQDVPVFCQLAATKINPLIDVEAIETIYFQGQYPREVAGIGFHPAKAALGYLPSKLNSPVLSNIGYVVIMLKRQKNESALQNCEKDPITGGEVCWVAGNLTAEIRYDIKNAWGVGEANYHLPDLSDNDFEDRFTQYSFWDGRGYLRAEGIDQDSAAISVYSDISRQVYTGPAETGYEKRKIGTFNLREGEESSNIYIPGLGFCLASLKLRLNDLEVPDTRAKLKVNADIFELTEKEKFLDNRCWVNKIDKKGVVEKVKVMCREDEKPRTFDFIINPKIKLSINGEEKEVRMGDWLYKTEDGKKSVYIGYIGTKENSEKEESLQTYLIAIPRHEANLTEDEIEDVASVAQAYQYSRVTGVGVADFFVNIGKFYIKGVTRQFYNWLVEGENIISLKHSETKNIKGSEVKLLGFAEPRDTDISESRDTSEYYEKAMQDYDTIIESFSEEVNPDEESLTLGEEALHAKIDLANVVGQKRTLVDLCEEFRQRYPDSQKNLRICDDKYKLASSGVMSEDVLINGRVKRISFEGIYEPTYEEYGAEILVTYPDRSSRPFNLRKNQVVYLNESKNEYIQLTGLEDDYAKLRVRISPENFFEAVGKQFTLDEKRLKEGVAESFGTKYSFAVRKINLKRFASVSVVPIINYAGTEADFGFKIGIEKRTDVLGLLAPDKVKNRIEKLDADIEEWQGISDRLGEWVQWGNKACLATGSILTVTNFWENAKGKGIARQEVMRGPNGWNERCLEAVKSDEFVSQEQCFIKKAGEIEADVNMLSEKLQAQQERIKEMQKEHIESKLFSEDVVDTKAFMQEDYSPHVQGEVGSYITQEGEIFINPRNPAETINLTKLKLSLSPEGWNKYYDLEQMRDIELYIDVLEDSDTNQEMREMAKRKLYSTFKDIEMNSRDFAERSTWASALNVLPSQIAFLEVGKDAKALPYQGLKDENGRPIQPVFASDGKKYVVALDDSAGTHRLSILREEESLVVYDETGKNRVSKIPEELNKVYFVKYDRSTYENPFKEEPLVRYFETQPYKGLPAIVPFDVNNGWYVAMKSTLPVFGNIRSFDASGKVNSFYLCNVGENGIAEFYSSIGDDICEGINLGTGQLYTQFFGLYESETFKLVNKAVKAIEEASRRYSSGVKRVSVLGQTFGVGAPATEIPDIPCQDFMSVKDCNLLFNVCDPFVCPSSRCDLGGAYPVKDVIQSGIIGGVMLCLPNFQEGIAVPVCVSGIHAGITGWLDVEKSYRDCLQHNIETGETIGICDEIHSMYMCDLFWRQAQPLAKIAIPKIVGAILGQNVRGGGEYLAVQDAWEKAGAAVTSFTQYYARNSVQAFKARSTEEAVGGAICQQYASIVVPSSGKLLDAITEPVSPAQFHGRFDEIPFTTVTNPPISHYKVFYHISAGSDTGAYYRVYLRSGPGGSFYQDTATIRVVDAGYIPRGEYMSNKEDFTAPSGYREMCIIVNGQEECGFKQISTSFAVNYIEDQYLAEQATQTQVATERECVSGTPSLAFSSLISPQGALEESISPAIYNRGITRICATDNPGQGTDAYAGTENSRWMEIGYCGNKNLKCWLDTESVKDVIDITTIEEEALGEVRDNYVDVLLDKEGYLKADDYNTAIDNINKEKSLGEKITLINNIIGKVLYNQQKAYLYLLRGNVYADLVSQAYKKFEKETEGEDEFISPIFEFEDGTRRDNLFYRYYKGKWQSSFDKREWKEAPDSPVFINVILDPYTGEETIRDEIEPNERNKKFIGRLEGKSYLDGLRLLIDRTLADEEGGIRNPDLVTEISEMNHKGIFRDKRESTKEYVGKDSPTGYRDIDLYMVYDNEWKWSFEDKNWHSLSATIVSEGKYKGTKAISSDLELLGSLQGQELYPGAAIIFSGGEEVLISEEEIQSEEPSLGQQAEGDVPSLEERYLEFKELFEKYSEENLPSGWGQKEFEALLVAIAQKESSLGYPAGKLPFDDSLLLGYDSAGRKFDGEETQIKAASATLKRALEKRHNLYAACNDENIREKLVECILSVYNTGKPPKRLWYTLGIASNEGKKYAADVMKFWRNWEEIFASSYTEGIKAQSKIKIQVAVEDTGEPKAAEQLEVKTEEVKIDTVFSVDTLTTEIPLTFETVVSESTDVVVRECVEEPVAVCDTLEEVSPREYSLRQFVEQPETTVSIRIDQEQVPVSVDTISVQAVTEAVTDSIGEVEIDTVATTLIITNQDSVPIPSIELDVLDSSGVVIDTVVTDTSGRIEIEEILEQIEDVEEDVEEETVLEIDLPGVPEAVQMRIQRVLNRDAVFEEYCEINVQGGGYYCAQYVTVAFEYVFGKGRSYLIGVRGDAWDFPDNIQVLNGERLYDGRSADEKFTDYDSLVTGDIFGFKKYADQPIMGALRDLGYPPQRAANAEGEGYTHAGLYLGKIDGKHMMTHKIGETIFVQDINAFIYKGGSWNIHAVLRPYQENLYIPPQEYIEKHGLVPKEYTVRSGDTLSNIPVKFIRDIDYQNANKWLITSSKGRDQVLAGEILKVYIPEFDFKTNDLRRGLEFLYDIKVKTLGEVKLWDEAIENAFDSTGLEKTSENYAIVLTILEKESSFRENPFLDMSAVCKRIGFPEKIACMTHRETVEKIKTEKDYVDSVFQKGLFGIPFFRATLTSAGPMQLNIDIAKKISGINDEEELYSRLFTKKGGVEYGVRYLKPIINNYAPDGRVTSDNLEFIFADYNAGLFKSRNAAFQKRINEIIEEKSLDVDKLVLDGYLGEDTQKIIKKVFGMNLDMENGKIKDSENKRFENTQIYKTVNPKEYAIVPDIVIKGPKYDSPLYVRSYVNNALKFFENYCNKMVDCDIIPPLIAAIP